jgi:glycosyltransferase involved in cell wall biosynthesis
MTKTKEPDILVLHLVESLAIIGGLETVLSTIVLNLDKKKYNTSVWCLKEGGFLADKLLKRGVEVKVLNLPSSKNPAGIYKLYRLLKRHKFDLIHTHAYSAGTIGRISAFLAGVPVIISHNHSVYGYYNKYYHFVEWLLSYITDRIICVSEEVKRFTNNTQGINLKKLLIIYNGIENICAVTESRSSSLKKEFGIPINHSVVGTISHMEEHKGIKYLIKSASLLLQTRNDIRFLIIGEGSLKGVLKKLCVNLKIEKKVIFAGERIDILELLSIIDIFVLPSLREGLGLAILEAMGCGKPVIATNVGGIPEVIKNRENGILVSPKNPEALYRAMNELLDDGEKREKMGRIGKRVCDERFRANTMVEKIEDLYDFFINKKIKK